MKELLLTLAGEGASAGRVAVFLRFGGCNLWRGREADRSTAICRFCHTDCRGTEGPGGGRYGSAGDLAAIAFSLQIGRDAMEHRAALIVHSIAELKDRLRAIMNGERDIPGYWSGHRANGSPSDLLV